MGQAAKAAFMSITKGTTAQPVTLSVSLVIRYSIKVEVKCEWVISHSISQIFRTILLQATRLFTMFKTPENGNFETVVQSDAI